MIGQSKFDRIVDYLDLFANERMHGAIVATAFSINPWAMLAISACLQLATIIIGTNLMDTNSALEAKIAAQNDVIAQQSLIKDYSYVNDHEIEVASCSLVSGTNYCLQYCFDSWTVNADEVIDFQAHLTHFTVESTLANFGITLVKDNLSVAHS